MHKFGGTSLGSADCMRKCIDIIRGKCDKRRIAMVVSAMGGKPKVTDLLLDSVHAAAEAKMDLAKEKLEMVRSKHSSCIRDLFAHVSSTEFEMDDEEPDATFLPKRIQRVMSIVDHDLQDILDLLKAASLMRQPHEQILELVSGYGEIWSARLLELALQEDGLPFVFLNARDVLVVSEEEAVGTAVHWEISEERMYKKLQEIDGSRDWESHKGVKGPHLIITGKFFGENGLEISNAY